MVGPDHGRDVGRLSVGGVSSLADAAGAGLARGAGRETDAARALAQAVDAWRATVPQDSEGGRR